MIVIEQLGGVVRGQQAVVDALVLLAHIKEIHADLAEGGAVMSEGAIADRRAGDGGEPTVEDGELGGESGQDGQLVRCEVVKNFLRVGYVLLLIVVAANEALHGGREWRSFGRVSEDLQVDGGKVVIGIGIELALVFRQRLDRHLSAGGIGIGFVAGEAFDGCFEGAEHVVERAVLHHENDNVLELPDSGLGSVWSHSRVLADFCEA